MTARKQAAPKPAPAPQDTPDTPQDAPQGSQDSERDPGMEAFTALLVAEFGDPHDGETPAQMAGRVLREQKNRISELEAATTNASTALGETQRGDYDGSPRYVRGDLVGVVHVGSHVLRAGDEIPADLVPLVGDHVATSDAPAPADDGE